LPPPSTSILGRYLPYENYILYNRDFINNNTSSTLTSELVINENNSYDKAFSSSKEENEKKVEVDSIKNIKRISIVSRDSVSTKEELLVELEVETTNNRSKNVLEFEVSYSKELSVLSLYFVSSIFFFLLLFWHEIIFS
jgi:sporulation protein YlmC with PRC-barrel domain